MKPTSSAVRLGIQARAFNSTIREARKSRRLTQGELAKAAGVSVATVCHLETLRISSRSKAAKRVLRVLGLDEAASPEWLLEAGLNGVREAVREIDEHTLLGGLMPSLMSGDPIADDGGIEDAEERADAALLARRVIEVLPPMERETIERRHMKETPETLREIGKAIERCPERVKQLEGIALARMRSAANDEENKRREIARAGEDRKRKRDCTHPMHNWSGWDFQDDVPDPGMWVWMCPGGCGKSHQIITCKGGKGMKGYKILEPGVAVSSLKFVYPMSRLETQIRAARDRW